ncbi:MAG: RES family NAD+ phosphorylase [Verrucomicrobia bacterium]|nr:RES family NAD+ phosphorylase [Verrucomicrobiota bacterium]
MRAWRICKRKYVDTAFNGEGAFHYGGRWNSRGVPVVYLGGNPSIAALEIIVNTDDSEDLYRIPYALIPVDFDESLVSRVETLPADWKQDPPPPSTAKIGDEWFRSRRSALLEVPSAVIPVERNFILSPLHEAFAQIKIGEPQKFEFDSRLVSLHRSQISEDL